MTARLYSRGWVAILAATIAALALSTPSRAEAQLDQQFEVWFAMPVTVDIGEDVPRLQVWFDGHARRGPLRTTGIIRPGIGLYIYSWMIATVGYGWIPTFFDEPNVVVHEHRIWEQLILNGSPPQLALQSRTRFEQRFADAGDDVALRLRQFLRLLWKPPSVDPFAFVFWDEIFIGLTEADWGQMMGFNQNRAFIGPAILFGDNGRFEAGYLNQWVRGRPGALMGHVLYTQLVLTL